MANSEQQFVNISAPPYSKRLKLAPGFYDDEAAIIQKELADKLYSVAKQDKASIYISSGTRTKARNKAKDITHRDNHSHGGSVDIQTIVYDEEKNSDAAYAQKNERRAVFIAKYATNDADGTPNVFTSGAIMYPNSGDVDVKNTTVKDISGGIVYKNRLNYGELQHAETPEFSAQSRELKEYNGKVFAQAVKNIYESDGTHAKNSKEVTGVIIDADGNETKASAPLSRMDYITMEKDENGRYIPNTAKVVFRPEGVVGTVKTSPEILGNPDLDVRNLYVSTKKGKFRRVRTGQTGDRNAYANYNEAYGTGSGSVQYADIEELPSLDDSRSVTPDELGIDSSLENKLIHNCLDDYHPYGSLAKYKEAEQPAAIRLTLDKLFQDERDAAAIEAWKAWEDSGVTYIDNFIMERVSNQSRETYQIIPSLGDEYKVYFGTSSPEVMSITGYTLNYANQQWLYDFRVFYDKYLKGSKLVENRTRAFLTFTDSIYEVLLTSFAYSESATTPGAVTISLECIVLQWTPFGKYQDPLNRRKSVTTTPTNHSGAQADLSDVSKKVIKMLANNAPSYVPYGNTIRQILLQNTGNTVALPQDVVITPPEPTPGEQQEAEILALQNKVNVPGTAESARNKSKSTEAITPDSEEAVNIANTVRNSTEVNGVNT
jgi:hypothetical protein